MLPNAAFALRASNPPFVSYAQNFEDVMLHRALGHVTEGRYLDIGAGEPDADSVTLAFYKANWCGINVEPLSGPFSRLMKQRPLDINLNVAVGSAIAEAVLYVVGPESGLSTLDPQFAEQYASEGWPIEERRVPITTLAELCSSYVQGDIHFLKIDAEGAEQDILRGADFSRWRPWIILVEATLPNSQIPNYQVWEPLLINNGYEFCYFDGLNRFYLSEEKASSLRTAFAVPPNVSDNFVLARVMSSPVNEVDASQQRLLHAASERADQAQARVHAAQAALDNEQARVAAAEARADHAQSVAHSALARVSDLQEELRTIEENLQEELRATEEKLSAAMSACESLKHAASSFENEAAVTRLELEKSRFERETWAQELFESERYAAELVKERQVLLARCASSAHQIARKDEAEMVLREKIERLNNDLNDKTQEIIYLRGSFDAVVSSTSWLLSKPIRVIGRLVRR
jgi:FkbM family methyltransferase